MSREHSDPSLAAFERALGELEATEDVSAVAALQRDLYAHAADYLERGGDLDPLYALAPRFDDAGLFAGSDWERPSKLQAGLVELTLRSAAGVGIEACSQLRLLAIANADHTHPRVAAEEARRFLERVLALNLRSLFAVESETAEAGLERSVGHLFRYLIESLGAERVMARLVEDAERILLTRPIKVERAARMIETAADGIASWGLSETGREAALLYDALYGPTTVARRCASLDEYAAVLRTMDDPGLLLEADTMSNSMRRTGLVCAHHAVLVRHANARSRDGSTRALTRALGLEDVGQVTLARFEPLVRSLIDAAVHPETAQCVLGLSQLLGRGVLHQAAVPGGLRALLTCRLDSTVARELEHACQVDEPPPARGLLIAGTLSVLGLPRGVDQGHNPTCQSARAISLWAQIDPGYLLRLIVSAARDTGLVLYFEGHPIDSRATQPGAAGELHPELDTVSLLLTPHLDRIYAEMSRRALDREQDEHCWVNPEMHGWWVHRGFAALIDEMTGEIHAASRFVRRFFAAYHPRFNGGQPLFIPQPCGVAATNLHGTFLDWHAVSIQRVDEDPLGELRVYFFNPNHDKGQDWGQGVVTSTSDHGELMGESSLPFAQFASRLYVFHYDPSDVGPLSEVPNDVVDEVVSAMRSSWGASFPYRPETA